MYLFEKNVRLVMLYVKLEDHGKVVSELVSLKLLGRRKCETPKRLSNIIEHERTDE